MAELIVAKNTTAPKIRRFRCRQHTIWNYLQQKLKGRKSCNQKTGEKPRNQKKSNKNRIRNIKIIASKKREKDAKSKNIRFFLSWPRNHYGFPEIIKSGVEITYGVWLQKHAFRDFWDDKNAVNLYKCKWEISCKYTKQYWWKSRSGTNFQLSMIIDCYNHWHSAAINFADFKEHCV